MKIEMRRENFPVGVERRFGPSNNDNGLPSQSDEIFSGVPFSSNGTAYEGKGKLGGDLAERDFHTKLAVLNHATGIYYEAILRHQETYGELPPVVIKKIEALKSGVDEFRSYVDNPNNYPDQAAQIIKERNINRDFESVGKSNIERIAARLAAADNKVKFLIDADGTLTKNPDYYLLKTIPGGEIAEPQIQKAGRREMIDMYVQTKLVLLEDASSAFEEAGQRGKEVEIREGVNEFFAGAHGLDAEYEIVSADFLPFVTGVLKQVPNASHAGITMRTVTDEDVTAIDKESVIRHVAQSSSHQAIIYIGDGSSDLPALQPKAAELVAGYFALKGSIFEKELTEKDLPFLPYENFDDINTSLQQISAINASRNLTPLVNN